MANYLYNGVELPDINTVWTDKTTYPYAYICFAGGYYMLTIDTVPLYAKTNGNIMTSAVGTIKYYGYDGTSWLEGDTWAHGADEIAWGNQTDVWTNTDILNEDGSIHLYASEPTTAEVKNYLYNGVELPNIDFVWDKGHYPYAVISIGDTSYFSNTLGLDKVVPMYALELLNQEPHYISDGDNLGFNANWSCYSYMVIFDKDWCDSANSAYGQEVFSAGGWIYTGDDTDNNYTNNFVSPNGLSWTSHDILSTDGSVYLKATKPVPVGNTDTTNYSSILLSGFMIGSQIKL